MQATAKHTHISDLFEACRYETTKIIGIQFVVVRECFGLLKQTAREFLEDKAPQLGAAFAYYTVFSLAPLILVLPAVMGSSFGTIRRWLGTRSRGR